MIIIKIIKINHILTKLAMTNKRPKENYIFL